jgi:hypothetical protein
MEKPEQPLAWWDRSQPRRAVVFSFFVALIFAFIVLFQDINTFYEKHSWLQNLLAGITVTLGLSLALLELRHSGEANEHRVEQNRLIEKANEFRDEANEYRREANRLSGETLELQSRIHLLQEDIEKKLTKVRLYARVRNAANEIQLLVSNLSDFDLWINQVRLVVTEAATASPGTRLIDGGKRISRGHTEDGFQFYGGLISMNGNRADRIDMKFHVEVEAVGVEDDPVTINSPEYHFTFAEGRRELRVLRYV